MNWRDILLQICQVLTVLLAAPLLQGVIHQFEERVQLAQGPGIFQPYRDLWKLFHKQIIVPETASWIYWIAPFVAFSAMLTVPILIPVLDRFSAAAIRHGRHPRRRAHSHARLVHDRARRPRQRQRLWRHRLEPRGDGGDPGGADADPGLRGDHAAGEGDAAFRGQSSAGRQSGGLLEPGASLSDRRILHAADRRDRPATDPFLNAYRSLHDRRSPHPRIFRAAARRSPMGVDDEAIHPLHHLLQRAAAALGLVARRHRDRRRRARSRRWLVKFTIVACAVVVVETAQSRLRFYRYQELLAASFVFAILAIIGTQLV